MNSKPSRGLVRSEHRRVRSGEDFDIIIGLLGFWALVLFVVTVGFNRSRLVGGFLAYDWLASVLIGMALWRRGWTATGGAVLSWGAMTRVFPGFLVFPAMALVGWQLWKRASLRRPAIRFLTAFTAACAVWFALSHTTGRGLNTWPSARPLPRRTDRHHW